MEFFKEGAYGCVFRPGMNCFGEKENSKFITKIQMDKETSDNEITIGRFIENEVKKDIPFYEDLFAPIISSCSIDLGKIENENVKKCEIVQKNNDATIKFVSNKIRYVGKYTLEPFLKTEFQSNIQIFYKHFFQSHKYLLNSLHILSNYNIIHYDLKQNNISIDDSKRIPVIIDFGLSFQFNDLTTDLHYEKYFYVYYDKYPPWCLEITIISFIVQEFKNIEDLHKTIRQNTKLKMKERTKLFKQEMIEKEKKRERGEKNWRNSVIDIEHLVNIIDHYFKYNYIIIEIKNKVIVEKAKEEWIKFVKKEFQDKTGEYIVRFLMKSWKTWDNYSLCVIYFSLFRSFFSDKKKQKKFMPYQQLLIDNIIALPLNRDESIDTTTKLNILIDE